MPPLHQFPRPISKRANSRLRERKEERERERGGLSRRTRENRENTTGETQDTIGREYFRRLLETQVWSTFLSLSLFPFYSWCAVQSLIRPRQWQVHGGDNRALCWRKNFRNICFRSLDTRARVQSRASSARTKHRRDEKAHDRSEIRQRHITTSAVRGNAFCERKRAGTFLRDCIGCARSSRSLLGPHATTFT